MIHTHKANGREYLLIQIPERAAFWEYYNATQMLDPWVDFYKIDRATERPISIDLPSGTYSIIGKASTLSEQQASEIVHPYWRGESGLYNYYGDVPCSTNNASVSLSSLLSSLGLTMENTLILQKL
jgi:hypothetical protein